MKKFFTTNNIIALSVALTLIFSLTFLFYSCGKDASVPSFSEDGTSETGKVDGEDSEIKIGISFEGITVFVQELSSGEQILCLPSGFSEGTWFLSCTDVLFENEEIKNGDAVSKEALGENFEMAVEGNNRTVRVMYSSSIPSVFLSSDDGDFSKIDGSVDHSYSSSGEIVILSENSDQIYDGELKKIRGRGNSTWNTSGKKPYQIQLSSKESLLGLPKAKKYVLLANYYDVSQMRNALAFELASLATNDYTPNYVFVDLYLCGEYAGLYILCDKIEIGENTIDITDLEDLTEKASSGAELGDFERRGVLDTALCGSSKWYEIPNIPEDVTGGYLLEADFPERYPDEVSGFVTSRGLPVTIKSPEYSSFAQVEYIMNYVSDFEDGIYASDGINPKGKHYSEYADTDSLAFRYLFEEYLLNIDAGLASFYFYKDSDLNGGKLTFSCVWDYDCAFGNYNKYVDLTNPETLFVASSETRNNGTVPSWFYAILKHEDFIKSVKKYYSEHFSSALSSLPGILCDLYEKLYASAMMDEALYSGYEDRNFYGADSGESFEQAYNYLAEFISQRTDFFEKTFNR